MYMQKEKSIKYVFGSDTYLQINITGKVNLSCSQKTTKYICKTVWELYMVENTVISSLWRVRQWD